MCEQFQKKTEFFCVYQQNVDSTCVGFGGGDVVVVVQEHVFRSDEG